MIYFRPSRLLAAPKRQLLLEAVSRTHARHRHKIILGVAAVAALLLISSGSWAVWRVQQSMEPSPASQLVVSDANYELLLPLGWKTASTYTSGAGINSAYNEKTNATLTIFATPRQADATASEHIDRELAGLRQNGGEAAVQSDAQKNYGVTSGRTVVAVSSKPRDPNDKTYRVYVAITYHDVLYNLDVTVPQAAWEKEKNGVYAMLDSFVPKSTTFRQPNALQ